MKTYAVLPMRSSTSRDVEQIALADERPLMGLDPSRDSELLLVTLRTAVAVSQKIMQALSQHRLFDRKADDSPATATDGACEDLAREMYSDAFGTSVAFMGEERGGEFAKHGYCVAIDPIDGTWGFIGDTGMYGSTINVFKDGKIHLGLVAQPSASEITYAIGDEPTRLLRATRWGQGPSWQTMPQVTEQKSIIVNMQPNAKDAALVAALHNAWGKKEIQQVRSTGGSPAVGMAEVAKGSGMFASNWKHPATPYDLAAPTKIIENAGGSTEDLDGQPIEPVGHVGIFVAGLRADHRAVVRKIMCEAGQA